MNVLCKCKCKLKRTEKSKIKKEIKSKKSGKSLRPTACPQEKYTGRTDEHRKRSQCKPHRFSQALGVLYLSCSTFFFLFSTFFLIHFSRLRDERGWYPPNPLKYIARLISSSRRFFSLLPSLPILLKGLIIQGSWPDSLQS